MASLGKTRRPFGSGRRKGHPSRKSPQDFSDFSSNEKSILTTIFAHKRSISSSDLDSTHSFPTFYRINIDWGLNYDGFMTMYGFM